MNFKIKKASRQIAKMRIGLFGPSGSGKTYSALRMAKGLVGDLSKVVVIDTENGSADLYSQLGGYSTLTLTAPFSPQRYIEAIKFCEQSEFELIIVDSISHEWEGVGGCLDIHSKLGGRFETWAKVTPLHNQFIAAIVQSNCHVITTGRSKIDYNFEGKKDGGKGKVEKIGLKTATREGFDYEMTVAFQLNQEHNATTDKDRTGLFVDPTPFLITESTGEKIAEWNNLGETPKIDHSPKIITLMKSKTDNFSNKELLEKIKSDLSIVNSHEITNWSEQQQLDAIAYIEGV